MKVRELIDKLEQLDQDREIFVEGFEGGCGEIPDVQFTGISLNRNNGSIFGEHEHVFFDEGTDLQAYVIGKANADKRKWDGEVQD